MTRWQVKQPRSQFAGNLALVIMASLVVLLAIGVGLAEGWRGPALLLLLIGGLLATLGGRLLAIGVYVSGEGVRIRWLLRTRTYAWVSVRWVRSQPRSVPFGVPLFAQARQLCFELDEGRIVKSPVIGAIPGGHPLLRAAYTLSEADFDEVLAALRELLERSRRPGVRDR